MWICLWSCRHKVCGTDQGEHRGALAALPASWLCFDSRWGCSHRKRAPYPQSWQTPTQCRGDQGQATAMTGQTAEGRMELAARGQILHPTAEHEGCSVQHTMLVDKPSSSSSIGAEFTLNLCTLACFAHTRIYIYTYILITYTYIYIHTQHTHPCRHRLQPSRSSWRGAW